MKYYGQVNGKKVLISVECSDCGNKADIRNGEYPDDWLSDGTPLGDYCWECRTKLPTFVEMTSTDERDNIEIPTEEIQDCMLLKTTDGSRLIVRDGDVMGRSGSFKNLLGCNDKISRNHARFTLEGDKWYVEDMNSTNGVFVDNIRVTVGKRMELADKQHLRLASCLDFIVEIK